MPNVLIHSLSLVVTQTCSLPFTCAQDRTTFQRQRAPVEGSLKSVPMHTASQAHPPIPSQSLQAPDTSPWAPESGPIEYTQSQDLTAGTCAAAWMATSHPMLLRTGRGRGDSRPDHFPLKPGQPTSLRRGSLCSGACLTGARDPQSWGWGPAEGNYVVQKPAEPINSRMHSDLLAPPEQGW